MVHLLTQARENLDRAWVAITSDPGGRTAVSTLSGRASGW